MAAFSRGLRTFSSPLPTTEYICSRCLPFSTAAPLMSGHSRWSKIKHDKGTADQKKNVQRSIFAHEIAQASKLYGGDPQSNPRLATVLATARKAGFPKASMEAAVARGQGISTTGAALENLTLEAIMPPSIALVVEVETDNRKRTLADLRFLVKSNGGTVTPTSYLFTKRGVVVFEKDERGLGVDEVLDDAIEAGAEDVETDDDGNIIVWTDPSGTTGAAEALKKSHDLKVKSSEIIWAPNEDTLAPFDSQEAYQALVSLVDALQDNPNVQGVYANVAQGVIEEGAWVELQGKIDV